MLGIDPGLRICGYAAVQGGLLSTSLLEAGAIRIKTDIPLEKRLAQISEDISSLIESIQPDVLAVEKLYAHYKHPRTSILMGHARGVILLEAGRRDIRVLEYAATRIKKSLTGSGKATKQQMQKAVQSVLGLPEPPKPADVADAAAIALCCAGEMETRY
ncbi:crossover junction endodeoxyribonuclease RuvC [Sedimentisphaera cyanobacteriorum]|uniref:crossover junction endodeoxyribonuclease RuvC n=1 Tax=Sedimentisphaera cyanobacteriorum TaxID=1940790 RepID=UPI001D10CF32|nr:crossover junction endodeoxyribonuclease RuvC [Sedimentisphaera cyanobacteriorum]